MIKHEGKEYRNLVEQVAKNKELINYILDEEGTLNQYGIKVIVEVENKAELDLYPTEELEYGDGAISRDNANPEAPGYAPSVYIWTRPNNISPVAYWAYMGKIRGPQGAVGPQGPQGERGYTGKDALYWVTGSFFDAAHDPYIGYNWTIQEHEISNYFSRDEVEYGDTFFNLFRNTVTGNVFATYWAIVGIEGSAAKYATVMKFESTRGPQGLQGNQGPQGIQGPEGPIGAQGPQGEQGIDGGLYPAMQTYANAEEGTWGPQVMLEETDPFYKMGYTSYNKFTITDPDTNFKPRTITSDVIYPRYKYIIQFFDLGFKNLRNSKESLKILTFEAFFYITTFINANRFIFTSTPIIRSLRIDSRTVYSPFLLTLENQYEEVVFRVYTNGLDMENFEPVFRYSRKQIME